MADFPQCVITATADRLIGGLTVGGELATSMLTGMEVTFTSNIPPGSFVTLGGELHNIPPLSGYIGLDGVLMSVNPEDPNDPLVGVALPADDISLQLETPLQYTVSFSSIPTPSGFDRTPRGWTFDAPEDGETQDLSATAHVVGMEALGYIRGPGLTGGAHINGDSQVYFDIEGGGITTPVDIEIDSIEIESIDGGTPASHLSGEIDGGTP